MCNTYYFMVHLSFCNFTSHPHLRLTPTPHPNLSSLTPIFHPHPSPSPSPFTPHPHPSHLSPPPLTLTPHPHPSSLSHSLLPITLSDPLPSIRSTACQWTTVALTRAVCLVCSQPIPCVGGAPLSHAACQQTAAARPAHSPVTTMLPAVLQLQMCHRSKLIL